MPTKTLQTLVINDTASKYMVNAPFINNTASKANKQICYTEINHSAGISINMQYIDTHFKRKLYYISEQKSILCHELLLVWCDIFRKMVSFNKEYYQVGAQCSNIIKSERA